MTAVNVEIRHEEEIIHEETDVELAQRNASHASSSRDDGWGPIESIDRLPVVEVLLKSLERGLFLRSSGTDAAHVKLLAEIASLGELPPILLQDGNWRIIDGMHRIEAARLRGEKNIRARFINCTDDEAFILAVKSNTQHGLPLSRSDRVFGAKRILTWHPDWSDRAVGAAAGLSAKTIARLRPLANDGVQQSGKRLGRDGKRRPVAGADGRRRAADYIAARPDASLREIAREADVSLGTAQDVRARLRRGAEPMTAGQQVPPVECPADADSLGTGQQSKTSLGPREASPTSRQPTWAAISAKLMNDPSLKYSEGGRTFIKWMTAHAANAGDWRELLDAIPAHWIRDIRLIADDIKDEWSEFAEQLRSQERSVSLLPADGVCG